MVCALRGFLLALIGQDLARARDLSPPKGRPPPIDPEFPDDPPPDPRCDQLRWGATDVGGGSASLAGHMQPLGAHAPPSGTVEELPAFPDPAEMYARARDNVPFIVRGGIGFQPALGSWTDAYIAKTFGSTVVDVEYDKKENRFGPMPVQWPLRRFVAEKGERQNADVYYVVHDLTPRMRRDWRVLPSLACREVRMQMVVMWYSSGGTSSVLHNDAQENFLTLVAGTKKLILIDQSEARNIYADQARKRGTSPVDVDAVDMELFPRVKDVRYREVELHKGDVLFIPKFMWHQVRSSVPGGQSRNLAVNYWWRYPFDSYEEDDGAHHRGPVSNFFADIVGYKQKWPKRFPCTKMAHDVTYDRIKIAMQNSGEESGGGQEGQQDEADSGAEEEEEGNDDDDERRAGDDDDDEDGNEGGGREEL